MRTTQQFSITLPNEMADAGPIVNQNNKIVGIAKEGAQFNGGKNSVIHIAEVIKKIKSN